MFNQSPAKRLLRLQRGKCRVCDAASPHLYLTPNQSAMLCRTCLTGMRWLTWFTEGDRLGKAIQTVWGDPTPLPQTSARPNVEARRAATAERVMELVGGGVEMKEAIRRVATERGVSVITVKRALGGGKG